MFTLTAYAAQAQTGCAVGGNGDLPGTPLAGNTGLPIDQGLLQEGAELSRLLGVNPAIFYMKESDGPNAAAVWQRFQDLLNTEGRPYCCTDGTVLIGLELIQSEWRATNGSGLSIPAIEAHEYAHIAQYKYGFPYQGKWRELHADYIAGWYTGHRGRFTLFNSPAQAMTNFFNKGDYQFNSTGHHGTPSERQAAFMAGFDLNVRGNVASGILAYQGGVQYISSLVASGN
jgi:hypothetical protein